MYHSMSTHVLFQLKDALMESHEFAKIFNSNNDQRNVLWKAGFHGNAKPNLMSQESQSLSLALRILFRIYEDEDRRNDWNAVEKEIQRYEIFYDAIFFDEIFSDDIFFITESAFHHSNISYRWKLNYIENPGQV